MTNTDSTDTHEKAVSDQARLERYAGSIAGSMTRQEMAIVGDELLEKAKSYGVTQEDFGADDSPFPYKSTTVGNQKDSDLVRPEHVVGLLKALREMKNVVPVLDAVEKFQAGESILPEPQHNQEALSSGDGQATSPEDILVAPSELKDVAPANEDVEAESNMPETNKDQASLEGEKFEGEESSNPYADYELEKMALHRDILKAQLRREKASANRDEITAQREAVALKIDRENLKQAKARTRILKAQAKHAESDFSSQVVTRTRGEA